MKPTPITQFSDPRNASLARRISVFAFGAVSYAIFFGVFLYLPGFFGNLLVPVSIDGAPTNSFGAALLINLGLIALFGLQHSIMARPTFKRWWTKIIPVEAERSFYTLLSSLLLIALFTQWNPMGVTIWNVTDSAWRIALHGVMVTGWLIVLWTTFLINHFDLFGLRQIWLYLIGKPYTQVKFAQPGPYKRVRHPMYIGWLLMFWGAPTMTVAHLAAALGLTAYILIAIQFEERNLVDEHGDNYINYKKRVPMLIPRLFGKAKPETATATSRAA